MNAELKQIIFWFGAYFMSCLLAYFIICVKNAKKYYGSGKYEVSISDADIMAIIFWPLFILLLIFVFPFKMVEKLAIKIKSVTKPEEIDAKNIIK